MNLFCANQAAASDGAAFLLVEPLARPSAQGGAYAAARGDLACIQYNPAGLAGIRSLAAGFSHLDSLSDWQHDWAGLAVPLAGSTLALDFLWSRIRPFPLFDSNGDQVGMLQAGSETLGAAWAGTWFVKGLSTGISLRMFTTQLAGYGNMGAAAGVGGLYRHGNWPWRVGLSVQNLGSQTAFIEQADSLPLLVRTGVQWDAVDTRDVGLCLKSDGLWHRDPLLGTQLRTGFEANLKHALYLEAGGAFGALGADYSFGLGIAAGQFRVDYSYSPHPVLGSYQRLSLDLLALAPSLR